MQPIDAPDGQAEGDDPGPLSDDSKGAPSLDAALDEEVREALSGPAQEIANQIAARSRFNYQNLVGNSPFFDSAVREALSGPAQEIANQIAAQGRFKYQSVYGNSPFFDSAVREALSGPAQEIANQISESSLGWLRNYSGQALEPAFFAEVARKFADEQLESPQSDYQPASLEARSTHAMTSPASVFEHYEVTVKSLQGLTTALDQLTRRLEPLTVVWRGQANADWGLHSTLYRHVITAGNERLDSDIDQPPIPLNTLPNEADMVTAERYLLTEIADRWRIGHAPAIELLSRMQHRGIPTRLLDATRSPLLALWFAVSGSLDTDARLFAIAHPPIPQSRDPHVESVDRAMWSDPRPFWFKFDSPSSRVVGAWGTGTRLREVVPPDYDKRILAQNAVFLLDGAPALTGSLLESFNQISGADWTAGDVAAAMSVVLAPGDPSRKTRDDSSPLSLVYTFRIPARLKGPIRTSLRRTYGLDWETTYPDMDGIKAHLGASPDWLSQARVAHPLSEDQKQEE